MAQQDLLETEVIHVFHSITYLKNLRINPQLLIVGGAMQMVAFRPFGQMYIQN